eukprot:m.77040 g.77040  ORF g.77040 m.77040 type:complete len:193 (+) comp50478_c0_seq1:113-691(+)
MPRIHPPSQRGPFRQISMEDAVDDQPLLGSQQPQVVMSFATLRAVIPGFCLLGLFSCVAVGVGSLHTLSSESPSADSRSSPFFLLAVCAACVGISLYLLRVIVSRIRLVQTGEQAVGTVKATSSEPRNMSVRRSELRISYSYRIDGVELFGVHSSALQLQEVPDVGTQLLVLYDAAQPDVSILPDLLGVEFG